MISFLWKLNVVLWLLAFALLALAVIRTAINVSRNGTPQNPRKQ